MKTILTVASLFLLNIFGTSHVIDENELHTPAVISFESLTPSEEFVENIQNDDLALALEAFSAFETADYHLAVHYFADLVKIDRTARNYLYLGLSNLEIGENEEAVQYLNVTLNNFDEFDSQAKWYLALAHLANNNEDAAISNLVSLTIENSIYRKKAEALLNELGLTARSLDYGVITDVKLRPSDDAPDGSFEGRRQIQFGYVRSETDGFRYYFLTDQPIRTLHIGSAVEMIIISRDEENRRGFAFILGER